MSGRMVRRLPVLAYARSLVGKSAKIVSANQGSVNGFANGQIKGPVLEPETWLASLEIVVSNENSDRCGLR